GTSALGAVVEARRPAGHGQRAQQVGVEDEPCGVTAGGQRVQGADEEEVLLGRGLLLLLGEPLRGLDHRGGRRVQGVVDPDGAAVGAWTSTWVMMSRL